MIEKVLVPLDGSRTSERSIPWARLFVADRKISLLHVIEPVYVVDVYTGSALPPLLDESDRYLNRLASEFIGQVETRIRVGPVARSILDVAQESNADLIAMTAEGGPTLGRRLFGGTVEQVVQGSEIPVLVVPQDAPAPPDRMTKIIVPVRGSGEARALLPTIRRVAVPNDSSVVFVFVSSDPREFAATDAERERHGPELVEEMERHSLHARLVSLSGKLPDAILELAEREGADLVAMAAHGRGLLKRIFRGSLHYQLIRTTKLPLLLMNQEARERSRWAAASALSRTHS